MRIKKFNENSGGGYTEKGIKKIKSDIEKYKNDIKDE